MMTIGHGFGMLAVGFAVILIAGIIILKVINHKPKKYRYGILHKEEDDE
jgi:hypothetical protein